MFAKNVSQLTVKIKQLRILSRKNGTGYFNI